MFTLMKRRPIFFSSVSTLLVTFCSKISRSALISSIFIVAIVARSWPKMMSLASASICCWDSPNKRTAALFIPSSSVAMPMVNRLGTFIRIFCFDNAPLRSISIVIGVRSRNAKLCSTGQTNVAPPWIGNAALSRPTLPYFTRILLDGHR